MNWFGRSVFLTALAAVVQIAAPSRAVAQAAQPSSDEQTKVVVAGQQYAKPGGYTLFFGKDYRDLWTTPVHVNVLDFRKVAGGLQIVRVIGGNESRGLALRGADGRDYSFRPVKKDLSDVVPLEFRDSIMAEIVQDQIAATVPGIEVVKTTLANAIGLLVPDNARLIVLPDDPVLGQHRQEFAGALGVFLEFPQPKSATNPGFRGATEILGQREFWEKRRASADVSPDTRTFLRARLLDHIMNDWDRHHGQWRWARVSGQTRLQPVPEDADMAASDYRGLALSMARGMNAPYVTFEDAFNKIAFVTKNGWDVDRFLLTEIDGREWMEIAADVQTKLTDAAIDEAVGRMPDEYRMLRGAQIAGHLKARRNGLQSYAERFYRYMAADVDVQGTDSAEIANVEWLPDDLEVTLTRLGPDGPSGDPFYRRRFARPDTKEVRIYLHDGNDRVVVRGQNTKGFKVRVIGGPGDDRVDGSGSKVAFYDTEGRNLVEGAGGTLIDSQPFTMKPRDPPNDLPWVPDPDWGRVNLRSNLISYSSDPGVVVGVGLDSVHRQFRKYPWGTHQTMKAAWAFGAAKPLLDYTGAIRRENSDLEFLVRARFSGVEQLRYFGLGNETEFDTAFNNVYDISDYQTELFPAIALDSPRGYFFAIGPYLQYSDSDSTERLTVLSQERPLGFGEFGHLGLRAEARWSSRKTASVFAPGVTATGTGKYNFAAWDADKAFGSLAGELSARTVTGSRMFWNLNVGGKQAWGDYPFFEAAYLGHQSMAGVGWNRFGGDATLYAGGELDFFLTRVGGLIPGDVGVLGFLDAGRVFLEGEDSSKWHPSGGAGVFYTAFQRTSLIGMRFGRNEDRWFFLFDIRMGNLAF